MSGGGGAWMYLHVRPCRRGGGVDVFARPSVYAAVHVVDLWVLHRAGAEGCHNPGNVACQCWGAWSRFRL